MGERILRYGVKVVGPSEVVKVLRGSIHVHRELVNRRAHHKEPLMEERFFRAQKRSSALLPNYRENQNRCRDSDYVQCRRSADQQSLCEAGSQKTAHQEL